MQSFLRCGVLVVVLAFGACGTTGERAPGTPRVVAASETLPELLLDEPPANFTIGVTIRAPDRRVALRDLPAARRPARYILQPDWVLRAVSRWDVSPEMHPNRVRTLSAEQVRRVWSDVRDSGLLGDDLPLGVRRFDGMDGVGEIDETQYLIYIEAGPVKRGLELTPLDSEGAQRIVERLARLAWIG